MQDITPNQELEALLGGIETYKSPTKHEITTNFNKQQLQQSILNQLNDTITQSNTALSTVLSQMSMSPSDPALISASASLLNAHTKVIAESQKLYMMFVKHQQQMQKLRLKLMSDQKINQDNNDVKVMLTREQAFQQKHAKAKVVDAQCS